MKHVKRIFSVLLAAALIVGSLAYTGADSLAAVKAPKLNTSSKDLLVGKSFTLKISNPIKGAKISFSSSNRQTAAVTSRGVVKGLKKGTAVITCKLETGKKDYTLRCKVTVRTAASKIAITNKITTIEVGRTYDLNRSLTPKTCNDRTLWSSSDKSIAEPDKMGAFTAKKTGTVTITAATLSGKKDSVKIKVVGRTANAATQAELDAALKGSYARIVLKTEKETEFTIARGNYTGKTLVVDAPNADVVNNGTFASIDIKAIKANTWYENALRNLINIRAAAARIVIAPGASAAISITGAGSSVAVENNGTITSLSVDGAGCAVDISGSSRTPVEVEANGEGAEITTSVPLDLTCNTSIELNTRPGAENSTIHAADRNCIPRVIGAANVVVFIGTGDNAQTVIVNPSSNSGQGQPAVTPQPTEQPDITGGAGLKGTITLSDSQAVSGAAIFLAKYDGSEPGTPGYNNAVYAAASNPNYIALADSQGAYEFKKIKKGNYIVLGIQEGYGIYVSNILLTENQISELNITLSTIEPGATTGSVSGEVQDATTAARIESGVYRFVITSDTQDMTAVNLETLVSAMSKVETATGPSISVTGSSIAASGSSDGVISAELENNAVVVVVSGSAFTFKLPGGLYDVTVTDVTEGRSDKDRYMDAQFNLFVLEQADFTNQNCIMTKHKEKGQAAFVLTWGQYPRDLDSHLLGPDSSGSINHIYFGNRDAYNDKGELELNLDVDDTSSFGPETVSIYSAPAKDGKYLYYVYNFSGNYDASIKESGARVVVATSTTSKVFDASAAVSAGKDDIKDKNENEQERYWVVCIVDANTGDVTAVNELVSEEPVYQNYIK